MTQEKNNNENLSNSTDIKTENTQSHTNVEQSESKIKQVTKVIIGVFIGLLVWLAVGQFTIFMIKIGGALGLGAIGINVSESARALSNLDAVANILGFFVGIIVAVKVYRKIIK